MNGPRKAGAYTAAILCSRKLLMHVAVLHGADPDWGFKKYVKWLYDKGHTPRKAKGWLTRWKDLGNEANHEVKMFGMDDATDLMRFVEATLLFMYQYADEEADQEQEPETPAES